MISSLNSRKEESKVDIEIMIVNTSITWCQSAVWSDLDRGRGRMCIVGRAGSFG